MVGAGIGFALGAGAAALTGNGDDWLKWGAIGGAAGGAIGYMSGNNRVQHGGAGSRSMTGGKLHNNISYSRGVGGYNPLDALASAGDFLLENPGIVTGTIRGARSENYQKNLIDLSSKDSGAELAKFLRDYHLRKKMIPALHACISMILLM